MLGICICVCSLARLNLDSSYTMQWNKQLNMGPSKISKQYRGDMHKSIKDQVECSRVSSVVLLYTDWNHNVTRIQKCLYIYTWDKLIDGQDVEWSQPQLPSNPVPFYSMSSVFNISDRDFLISAELGSHLNKKYFWFRNDEQFPLDSVDCWL